MGPCPACGAALSPWITVPAGEPSDTRRFDLARCAACGTAVTAGPPPGPEAYEQGVYAPGSARPAVAAALQRATVGQPVRALRRAGLRPGARVLDAGAGRGRLVAELRRQGFDAYGIDPLGRQAGGAVRQRSIAGHEDTGLDAVVLWHVAEHLDDPLAALERVRGWLAPGGLVLLGVPNAASLQARLAGPAWMHWDAPRHRQHFTPARRVRPAGPRRALARAHRAHGLGAQPGLDVDGHALPRAASAPPTPSTRLKRRNAPPARPRPGADAWPALPLVPVARWRPRRARHAGQPVAASG